MADEVRNKAVHSEGQKSGERRENRGERRTPGRTSGRLAVSGLLLALALALSYIESLIPFFFGIPGMKLGLPNLAVVLLLYLDDPGRLRKAGLFDGVAAALTVNALRIVLSGFFFGSLFGILFSLSGAAVSFVSMLLARRTGLLSVVGVSILGGVLHNIGQLLVARFIVQTSGILYYAPALILSGALTGFMIGVVAGALLPYGRRICGCEY